MADLHLPTTLAPLFVGLPRVVDVAAATVREAIECLEGQWPGMRDRLCREEVLTPSTAASRSATGPAARSDLAWRRTLILDGHVLPLLRRVAGAPRRPGRASRERAPHRPALRAVQAAARRGPLAD